MDGIEAGYAGLEVQVGGEIHNPLNQQLRHLLHRLADHQPVQLVHRLALHTPLVAALHPLQQTVELVAGTILIGRGIGYVKPQLRRFPVHVSCGRDTNSGTVHLPFILSVGNIYFLQHIILRFGQFDPHRLGMADK